MLLCLLQFTNKVILGERRGEQMINDIDSGSSGLGTSRD